MRNLIAVYISFQLLATVWGWLKFIQSGTIEGYLFPPLWLIGFAIILWLSFRERDVDPVFWWFAYALVFAASCFLLLLLTMPLGYFLPYAAIPAFVIGTAVASYLTEKFLSLREPSSTDWRLIIYLKTSTNLPLYFYFTVSWLPYMALIVLLLQVAVIMLLKRKSG